LKADQQNINDLWAHKEGRLKEQLELQLFNREADHIDTATKAHEAFLDIEDLGVNLVSEQISKMLSKNAFLL
jgi:spectrin beta